MISYADAVLVVFSVTDRESFNNAKFLVEKVRGLNVNNIPVLVVANKIDKKRTVTKLDIEAFSKNMDVTVLERSAAIPTEDVASLFAEMYRLVQASKKQRRDSDPTINDPSAKFNLTSIRRLSTSLDENDFIKLVL
jgi:GTPase SAR1 and related small G proteins